MSLFFLVVRLYLLVSKLIVVVYLLSCELVTLVCTDTALAEFLEERLVRLVESWLLSSVVLFHGRLRLGRSSRAQQRILLSEIFQKMGVFLTCFR